MFEFLKGKIVSIKPDKLIILVGSIGFGVKVPLKTFQFVRNEQEIQIYTSVVIKEETIEIYGFLELYEKELFDELIKISGIGPITAMSIISTYDRDNLENIIEKDDVKSLSRVPGIGKKTAQRILLELKGVLPSLKYELDRRYEDILSALVNLGYKKTDARGVLEKVYSKEKDEASIIKECLNLLAGKNAEL
ncbi:MAG: Holliday junction branch migration protein RuvA [Thermodesulfovibrio sp.]|nr:Holliday junction branch migration protein RuvA [Thermodesulfovibrio sp.]